MESAPSMLDDPNHTALLLIAARSAGRVFLSCGFPVNVCGLDLPLVEATTSLHLPRRCAGPGTIRPIVLLRLQVSARTW